MYDSHIHLADPLFENNLDYIITGMKNMKIKACSVSMDSSSSKKTLNIAKKCPLILPFIGIHPECSNDNLEEMLILIEDNINLISGVGEIGLDPTFIKSENDKKNQIHIFKSLLSIAEKYQKPISIHSRKSLDNIFEIMSSYDTKKALLHWFDGSKKQLKKAMDLGFFVSYGPVLIYANDKQTLLDNSDENRILVETDGPVRFSRCFEMKNASIEFIPSIIFCASKILNKSYEELTILLEKNSKNYLGI